LPAPHPRGRLRACALVDAGALSVDVSDPLAGTAEEQPLYGEPGAPSALPWSASRVTALFPADADWHAAMRTVAAALALPLPPHESYPVAEQDWVRETQAQFGPIEIAPRFWIVPSWSEAPDPRALNLRLDPGLAFGTGSHPTTRLCLVRATRTARRLCRSVSPWTDPFSSNNGAIQGARGMR
jgi:ribosomal protein L11 methyltransferase